jgi:hypothetical protein
MSPDDADSQDRIAERDIGRCDVGVGYVCNCEQDIWMSRRYNEESVFIRPNAVLRVGAPISSTTGAGTRYQRHT